MVEVSVARLGLDTSSNAYVVVLQEQHGERLLPIWIGQAEAESIVMQIHDLKRVRPLTHDLCRSLILGLGGRLERVAITRVEQNTYFAELHVQRGADVVTIDARPSDGIAIALRLDAPIFAADDLLSDIALEMSESGEDDAEGAADDEPTGSYSSPGASPAPDLSAEQLKSYLERLRPEDFGKFNP